MTFEEYQKKSRETAVYHNAGSNFVYPTLGLCGEAGEVAEKIKRVVRAGKTALTEEQKLEVKKELGDVLWYLAQLGCELGISLEDVAATNIEKLLSRKNRDQLSGSGDNR